MRSFLETDVCCIVTSSFLLAGPCQNNHRVLQGYLAHKTTQPPRTLPYDFALGSYRMHT